MNVHRKNVFRYQIGAHGREVLKTLPIKNAAGAEVMVAANQTYNQLKAAMRLYLRPKDIKLVSRVAYLNRKQLAWETATAYLLELDKLALDCDWENVTAADIKMLTIMCGLKDGVLAQRLLGTPDLQLQRCLNKVRASETAKWDIEAIRSAEANGQPTIKSEDSSSSDDDVEFDFVDSESENDDETDEPENQGHNHQNMPRRSQRIRRPPERYGDPVPH